MFLALKSWGFQNAFFTVALWNSTLAIALPKIRAKPIQTPKTPACICSFGDKKVMREFLRKKIWGNFYNFKTIKAGVKTPALTVRHIGIGLILAKHFFLPGLFSTLRATHISCSAYVGCHINCLVCRYISVSAFFTCIIPCYLLHPQCIEATR